MLSRHRGAIHRVCRAYAIRGEEHGDLFQEVVYQLWRAFPGYRDESSRATWLYRIAVNTAITRLRRHTRRPPHVPLGDDDADRPDPVRPTEIGSQVEQLHRALRELSEVERALVMLYLEDLSYKQISEVLGISEANVGTKLTRTKAKLQEIVRRMS